MTDDQFLLLARPAEHPWGHGIPVTGVTNTDPQAKEIMFCNVAENVPHTDDAAEMQPDIAAVSQRSTRFCVVVEILFAERG